MLVATVSVMSLPTPHCRTAFRTTVALAAVASDADCEYSPAGHVAANPKPKDRILAEVHIGHTEMMPIVDGLI